MNIYSFSLLNFIAAKIRLFRNYNDNCSTANEKKSYNENPRATIYISAIEQLVASIKGKETYKNEFDNLVECIYENLNNVDKISAAIHTFAVNLKAKYKAFSKTEIHLGLKYINEIKTLIAAQNSQTSLKRLKSANIKPFENYQPEESFFAFLTLIIDQIAIDALSFSSTEISSFEEKDKNEILIMLTPHIDKKTQDLLKELGRDSANLVIYDTEKELLLLIDNKAEEEFLVWYKSIFHRGDILVYEHCDVYLLSCLGISEDNFGIIIEDANKSEEDLESKIRRLTDEKLATKLLNFGAKLAKTDKDPATIVKISIHSTLQKYMHWSNDKKFDDLKSFQKHLINVSAVDKLTECIVSKIFGPNSE